jgi:hypothetical protein
MINIDYEKKRVAYCESHGKYKNALYEHNSELWYVETGGSFSNQCFEGLLCLMIYPFASCPFEI